MIKENFKIKLQFALKRSLCAKSDIMNRNSLTLNIIENQDARVENFALKEYFLLKDHYGLKEHFVLKGHFAQKHKFVLIEHFALK